MKQIVPMKHIEKLEDFPPKTLAFLRESGFSSLDQLVGHEIRLALFAAAMEVEGAGRTCQACEMEAINDPRCTQFKHTCR